MNVVLFDEEALWHNLLPLTFTRPVSEIRIGILTIREKWEKSLNGSCTYLTKEHLSKKYQAPKKTEVQYFINSAFCPDETLVAALLKLKAGEALYKNDRLLATHSDLKSFKDLSELKRVNYEFALLEIRQLYDIFKKNADALLADFKLLSQDRKSEKLSSSVTVIGDPNLVFLEKGAKAEACILNTKEGPVYIGTDAEIMEGSAVRGPFALCEHSVLKLNSKVYGATTIGPHSKCGGELSNSVIFGYSNKAHDGFLGNSVLGEWCNLGADTNNSNLKNNYGNVKLYNYAASRQVDTGLQFCGLMMGDYSKAGINTMFNTGTVVGVGCNIYGGDFPPTFVPDFSWGGSEGFDSYDLEKLFETTEKVYERRGLKFGKTEKEILNAVYGMVAK